MFPVPTKPFATPRDSPASSTGDSSSGRAPLTPRDGSDIASGSTSTSGREQQWSGGASGLGLGHAKRRSKGKNKPENDETRRRDRRRDEAKAAIELGNVINGRGPIVDDDEEDTPINQITSARMSTMGPMMGAPMPLPDGLRSSRAWYMGPLPPAGDPAFFAAHQHAMMYAKQAYQMAVAQQAMAAGGRRVGALVCDWGERVWWRGVWWWWGVVVCWVDGVSVVAVDVWGWRGAE
ncbi:hypothetical protein F5146DRAFT_1144473 [Armillaria mellea]|nr:hypothetical protein F5146DRAFT_1144473 [Armillaria mellea]